jgi:telomere length regulation protein
VHEDEEESGGESGGAADKNARVLTSALELALVVLETCMELDGGRSLSLEHTALLLAAGEWAQGLFALLEKGVLIKGGGGVAEVRLRKAAAGVVIKVDEVSERWKRSTIDFTI